MTESMQGDNPEPKDATPDQGEDHLHIIWLQCDEDASISRSTASQLLSALDKRRHEPPERTTITLWLDTPGGDAHAAYKLALSLRSRCKNLRVVVPHYAKSAGTLLCLAADELLLTIDAELGPLDAQIKHPDRDLVVSALDVADALTWMAIQATQTCIAGGSLVLRFTELDRTHVLDAMFHFLAELHQGAISKLDPSLILRASKQLRVAEKYAVDLLTTRRALPLDTESATSIAQSLVKDYPAHGFVISRREAVRLGLTIGDPAAEPLLDPVCRGLTHAMEVGKHVLAVVRASEILDRGGLSDQDDDGSDDDADEDVPAQDAQQVDGEAEDGGDHDAAASPEP